jgi:hypothetical protein
MKSRRASSQTGATERLCQLKISLKDVRPPVWRRVLVGEDSILHDLHRIIQSVMGWTDTHLHEFDTGHALYTGPCEGDEMPEACEDSRQVTLRALNLKKGQKIDYVYDFGDDWVHHVRVEDIRDAFQGESYPVCVAGKRACPPEDCGGAGGYAEFLEAVSDPEHPQHKEMIDWVGGGFDPEEFDLVLANEALQAELGTHSGRL